MNVINNTAPLSFAQQSLWLQDRLQAHKTLYNTFKAWRVSGMVDVQILERCVNEIVQRHEILRTSFDQVDGQAVQVIASALTVSLLAEDLTAKPAEIQNRLLLDSIQREASTAFDLRQAPLLRTRLFCMGEQEYVFLLTVHHIIFDGWSADIFLRELGILYSAFSSDRPSLLPELPLQYADFAVWQREWLQEEAVEQQLAYWKQHLAGAPHYLEIPADHARPLIKSFEGALFITTLPRTISEQLKAFSSQRHVTLFMTLLSAFAVLLQRYTGHDDLLIAAPMANRSQEELEPLIGFFINTVALRTDLSGNPTFETLLERVRTEVFEAYSHQDLPFERLIEALHPQRSSSYTPLCQVAFALQSTPRLQENDCPIVMEPMVAVRTVAKYDISLYLEDTVQGLRCEFEYSTDLFEESTIMRMARQFQILLEDILVHAQRGVGELALLPPEEWRLVIEDWNTSMEDGPEQRCLHELFEWQVARGPDTIALVYEVEQLTYAALNRHANQLAHFLRTAGVGPDVLVGLCFERSLEMVVALLGVLKAGGAYVPLDPAYPQERLAYMLHDARVGLVITQDYLRDCLPQGNQHIFCLDAHWSLVAQQAQVNPACRSLPEHLAYVIYTSGSTGRPKGVLIPHRGFANLSREQTRIFDLQSSRRVLQVASFSFDISVFEITKALLSGGTLHLYPHHRQMIGTDLFSFLRDQAIEVTTLTPAALATLAHTELPALKNMLVGGEACPLDQARFWSRGRRFFHGYGPTESTILASGTFCTPEQTRMHIGHPIARTQLYVLNQRWQPVPIGVPGELCIGGIGLARGYHGCADLTAERFIPHPFSRKPGARLYRTGDRVRSLPDGNVEFLGRIDHQVKIRGHRIELDEIETILGQHPGVQNCVVLAREDMPGNKRLVAYIVMRADYTWPTTDEWRHALKKKLPDYMLPTVFMRLDMLPLTTNGKIDRRALPVPADERPTLGEDFVAPRNATEQQLTQIWQDVLGIEHIGIHDNFFTLGGDSILSLQIVARAHQCGMRLKAGALFQYQTIAELGTTIEIAVEEEPTVLRTTHEQSGLVPLTPIQHWFFAHEIVDRHHWNQSVLLEVPNHWSHHLLQQAMQHVVDRHEAFRLRFVSTSAGWLAHLAPQHGEVPVALVDLHGLTPAIQQAYLADQAASVQRSLDLEQGPLIAAAFFLAGNNQANRLLLVAHHLVIDAVSWRILLNDLRMACEHLMRGEAIHLPLEHTSWSQWARALTATAQATETLEQLPFWEWNCGQQITPLPLDTPGGSNQVAWARTLHAELTEQETRTLLHQVPETYRIRVHEVLLTALAQTLAAWWNSDDIVINVEGHGREGVQEDMDITRTVGWFTSLYPLRLQLAAHDQPGGMLKYVKERLRRIPGGGVGYGALRYIHEQGRKRLQAVERTEIAFNYQGQHDHSSDSAIHLLQEGMGAWCNEQGQRTHILEIHGQILEGRFCISWTYSEQLHRRETIERLAQTFILHLRQLIEYCCNSTEFGYTPADFDFCPLSQLQMDQLIRRLQPMSMQIQDIYPLSNTQQGIIFHHEYGQEAGIYHVQAQMSIEQELNMPAFIQSWRRVMEQHAVLRSSIYLGEGEQEPVQIVWRQMELPYEWHDWQQEPAHIQQERLQDYLQQERLRGFALEQGPLWKIALFHLGPQHYELVYSFHHVILDGWSSALITDEVANCYAALVQGRAIQLHVSQPYREYIRWLHAQDLTKAEYYWRAQLQGFQHPTPLGLPGHTGRLPVLQASEEIYADEYMSLTEQETTLLTAFGRTYQLTLNTIVQGMWGLLLSRYGGEEDVVFGVAVSGRPGELQGIERMTGMFINTLPLRLQVNRQAIGTEWLQEIQAKNREMRQYEYCPLIHIQQWSEIEQGKPLFESILVFENYPVNEQGQTALRTRHVRSMERVNYPIALGVAPGACMTLRIAYDVRLFQQETMQRVLHHLRTLLHSLASRPQEKLANLALLPSQDLQRMVIDWNSTQTSYPAEQSLPEQFEQQVERIPDAIALTSQQGHLTYCEINRRANQLAHYVQHLGVGLEECVGLAMERSPEMVIGMLAVLKVGGVYVPLDYSYPQERLAFMIRDAGIRVIITLQQYVSSIPQAAVTLVDLDRDGPHIAQQATSHVSPPIRLSWLLAYIMYTSGSTGHPKGVAIPHHAVTRLVRETNYIRFVDTDVVAHLSNTSFDAATLEIWGALLNGARLLVIPRRAVLDPAVFGHLLHEEACSVVAVTTALLNQLIALDNAFFRRQRRVLFGGEAADPQRVRQALNGCPPQIFVHAYGPTESTSIATWYLIREVAENAATVPIGRPIANTQAYVLDLDMQVVPVGIVGELYLGGAGLARGYINRADATAEYFVPHPFSLEKGARLYKTGDLVRYQADGTIEFVGRVDHQVKIRGLRIEPGEIEVVLGQHPAVRACIVLVHTNALGEKSLVAYVASDQERTSSELQDFLRERLPAYMIPQAIVLLDTLPLNPNGKIDRQALPTPDMVTGLSGDEPAPPLTETEKVIAAIWSKTLGVEQVDTRSTLFELGGHSLMAVRIVNQIREAFTMDIPLYMLFEAPTVAGLAERVDALRVLQNVALPAASEPVSREEGVL